MDSEFDKIYNLCQPYTMTSLQRMKSLYMSMEYVIDNNIPGDFVECGVWKGGSSMLVAKYFELHNISDRKLYLYDTFSGMSEPSIYDVKHGTNKNAVDTFNNLKIDDNINSWCLSTLDEVKRNMALTGFDESNIIYVEGKVEDTIPDKIPKNISLLRLDTDWYESTKHELEHLFPILSDNGILIIDDYGHWDGARKAVDDYFKNIEDLELQEIDYTGRLLVKTFEL